MDRNVTLQIRTSGLSIARIVTIETDHASSKTNSNANDRVKRKSSLLSLLDPLCRFDRNIISLLLFSSPNKKRKTSILYIDGPNLP